MEQIRAIYTRAHDGGELDVEQLSALCQTLQATPERIPREEAATVVAMLEELAALARAKQVDIGEELKRIRGGREAMRGYGRLRSAKTAQRLFRQA